MTFNAYRTSPQREYKAEAELIAAGLRAVVPSMKVRRRIGGKRVELRVPICSSYVFADGHLYGAKHVKGKVGPVHPHELQRLDALQSPVPWAHGDLATVSDGPLCGSEVVFLEVRGRIAIVEGFMMGHTGVSASTSASCNAAPRRDDSAPTRTAIDASQRIGWRFNSKCCRKDSANYGEMVYTAETQ